MLGLVPWGHPVADVGCDHARLLLAGLLEGRIGFGVGIEASPLALESARRNAARWKVENGLSLRLGRDLSPVRPGEVDVVVMAGVGGRNILRCIHGVDDGWAGRLAHLIVQPNRDVDLVRATLVQVGWRILDERLPESGGRHFPTVHLVPGRPSPLEPLEALLGPVLMQAPSTALFEWAERALTPHRAGAKGAQSEGLVRAYEAFKLSKLRQG